MCVFVFFARFGLLSNKQYKIGLEGVYMFNFLVYFVNLNFLRSHAGHMRNNWEVGGVICENEEIIGGRKMVYIMLT